LASNDRTREAATLAASCGVIVVAGRLVRPLSSDALHQPPMIAAPIAANTAPTTILRPLIPVRMLRQPQANPITGEEIERKDKTDPGEASG
jgi:hypothetical protein